MVPSIQAGYLRFCSRWVFGIVSLLLTSVASAGEVAVVCADAVESLSASESVSARIRTGSVSKKLGATYDRVDFHLCRASSDVSPLVQRLRARAQSHRTDFFDIRLERPTLTAPFDQGLVQALSQLSIPAVLPRMRMVLTRDHRLAEGWTAVGVRAVAKLPEGDVELTQRAWLLRFVEIWQQTHRLTDAVSAAREFADEIAPVIRSFSKSDSFTVSTPESATLGARLYSAFAFPGGVVGAQVEGVPQLIDHASGPAWDLLKTTFPHPIEGLPGRIDEELPEGELVWIDGDGLRYFLAPLKDWLGSEADRLLSSALGLRLVRKKSELVAALYFREAQRVSLRSLDLQVPDGELRSIHVPRTLRLALRVREGVASLRFLPVVDEPLALEVAWKGLAVLLEPKGAEVDLTSGETRIDASVLGGLVRFVARLNLFEKRFDGIDFWQSIDQKQKKFTWPKLRFLKEE